VISMLPLPGRMILPSRPAAPRGPSAGLVDYAATNHPGPDTYLTAAFVLRMTAKSIRVKARVLFPEYRFEKKLATETAVSISHLQAALPENY